MKNKKGINKNKTTKQRHPCLAHAHFNAAGLNLNPDPDPNSNVTLHS